MLITSSSAPRALIPSYGTNFLRTFAEDLSSITSRAEDIGWEASGLSRRRNRDLLPADQVKQAELCYRAWRSNPLAHRLIEMQVNFVLGNGISLTSQDEQVREIIHRWWTDPYNNWPKKCAQRLRDLYIYGELFHAPKLTLNDTGSEAPWFFVRDIQPTLIRSAVTDPENHSEINSVILKIFKDGSGNEVADKEMMTVRRRLRPNGTLDPTVTGELFYFGINRTTDALRGVGELYAVLDYVDLMDDLQFSRAEKIINMSHMYWDMKMTGSSEQEIKNYLVRETMVPVPPGGVYGHNENIELNLVTPQMHADDHSTDVHVLRSFIISSLGWPGTYFDDPGSSGRAVGAEMAEPALKNIQMLQAQFGQILREEMDYALYLAWKYGQLKISSLPAYSEQQVFIPPQYQINFVRGSNKGIQQMGPALARIGQFIDTAANKLQVLTKQESRDIVVSLIHQLTLSDAAIAIELPVELERPVVTPAPGVQVGKAAPPPAAPFGGPSANANGNVNGNANGNTKIKVAASASASASALPTHTKAMELREADAKRAADAATLNTLGRVLTLLNI